MNAAEESPAGTLDVVMCGAVLTLVRSIALWLSWGWLVSPLGVTDLTFPHAIGLYMMIDFVKSSPLKTMTALTDKDLCASLHSMKMDVMFICFCFLIKILYM